MRGKHFLIKLSLILLIPLILVILHMVGSYTTIPEVSFNKNVQEIIVISTGFNSTLNGVRDLFPKNTLLEGESVTSFDVIQFYDNNTNKVIFTYEYCIKEIKDFDKKWIRTVEDMLLIIDYSHAKLSIKQNGKEIKLFTGKSSLDISLHTKLLYKYYDKFGKLKNQRGSFHLFERIKRNINK